VTMVDMSGRPNPGPRGRYQAERTRQRRRDLATLITVAAMLAPIVLGSLWVLSSVETATEGNADVLVEVEPDWAPAQVAAALAKTNVVKSAAAFQAFAEGQGVTTFKPGRYYFYENEGSSSSLATLRGAPAEEIPDQKLLIPPGLTLAKIADRVGALENKSRDRFLEVAKSGTIRSKFEPASVQSLEGLTWPDTYFIGATETEAQILQRIVTEFDKRATAAGIADPNVNPYNTTNVAAMVQTEAGNDADMPAIAAVLWNRLAKGMPLQVDATLCYAKGGCPPVPTNADKLIDSPYNTYKVNGLPPTPIATASQAALTAALHPASVDYLYYVADKNGKTYFASTLAEHERNIVKARNAQ
jgi:UPF0755 protein